MKSIPLLILSLLSIQFALKAQTPSQDPDLGFLIFNMGANHFDSVNPHPAHILACDTIIKVDSLFWNTPKQIRSGMPFGYSKGSFKYISKYYIASPPLFTKSPSNPDAQYNIGLVTPDEFWFEGDRPAQLVYMDYSTLQLMQIEYFPFTYDATFSAEKDILVPFKVECANFPWNERSGVAGAEGASGIGFFQASASDTNKLFLPYQIEALVVQGEGTMYIRNYLDCKITLLNDILSDHELKFVVNDTLVGEQIDLQA